jgi:peptide/nickel transport system substrate-binding protein
MAESRKPVRKSKSRIARALSLVVLVLLPASGLVPASRLQAASPGQLRVGAGQDLYVLSGPRTGLGMYPLNANIFETLTSLSSSYQVKPLLAVRWKFRAPNTWRFYLRKGVKFQDGQPFDAEAVKVGLFDRTAKVPGGGTIASGPNSAVVVSNYVIDFTPMIADLRVPEQLVHPNYSVVAPGTDPGTKPIGTGPFRFVSYRTGEQIVVERNPSYWGAKPKLSRITFQFYPDDTSRQQALQAGNVDVIFDVPRPAAGSLKSAGFNIVTSKVGAYEAMYANIHGSAPYDILQDLRVRQAIAYAIDRKLLVGRLLDGLAATNQTFVPPSSLSPYASLIKGYHYDVKKAKTLLDADGWKVGSDGIRAKNGRSLKLTLVSGFPSAAVHRPIPEFLQAELRKIGIDLTIVERPDSASYQALITSGQGDLYLEQGNQNDANPGFLPVLLFYTGGSGASAPYQKLFAPGANFDRLIKPSLTAVNPKTVRKAVAEAMHYIIDTQAVIIPLAGIYRIYGMKKSVHGFMPHPAELDVQWAGVSLTG